MKQKFSEENGKNKIFDLLIVGGGPAGMNASIYAKRALLEILVFEKNQVLGGKLNKTEDVDNYIGFPSIKGARLAEKMKYHMDRYRVPVINENILKVEKKNNLFLVKTESDKLFLGKAVIIASGAKENILGADGEVKFESFGVSYCAVCDGFLFKGKVVAVIGGGYSALETAIYMTNIAETVHLVHRGNSFKAGREIVDRLRRNKKIIVYFNSTVKSIVGKNHVEGMLLSDGRLISLNAVFPCVGLSPVSYFVNHLGICDKQKYINVDEDCSTSIAGLFAAGDVARQSEKKIKQIVTAIADGAVAAQSAIKYLEKLNK
jgi:thioredoxin reductase (NADPH)